jgi:hypothetical protein
MSESEDGGGRRRRRRIRGDQIVLTLILWCIPISLFGYVGAKIAEATGRDPYEYLPDVAVWQVVAFVAIVVGALGAFAAFRLSSRSAKPGDTWDTFDNLYEKR